MRKLICEDGTEVAISKETEENLRKQFGKKEGFKPMTVCCLSIAVTHHVCPIQIQTTHSGDSLGGHSNGRDIRLVDRLNTTEAKQLIKSLQAIIGYIENK